MDEQEKYSELQAKIVHAYILPPKGILGICFGNIGEGHPGTLKKLVELWNDPTRQHLVAVQSK